MATAPPDRDQLTYVWAVSRIGTGAMTTSGTDLLQRTLAVMCTVSLSYLRAQILSACCPSIDGSHVRRCCGQAGLSPSARRAILSTFGFSQGDLALCGVHRKALSPVIARQTIRD